MNTRQIVYVTGGNELTITSTAAASTMSNVHFEVIGYTSLVLDVPDLTMSGIYQSVSENVLVFFFGCAFAHPTRMVVYKQFTMCYRIGFCTALVKSRQV